MCGCMLHAGCMNKKEENNFFLANLYSFTYILMFDHYDYINWQFSIKTDNNQFALLIVAIRVTLSTLFLSELCVYIDITLLLLMIVMNVWSVVCTWIFLNETFSLRCFLFLFGWGWRSWLWRDYHFGIHLINESYRWFSFCMETGWYFGVDYWIFFGFFSKIFISWFLEFYFRFHCNWGPRKIKILIWEYLLVNYAGASLCSCVKRSLRSKIVQLTRKFHAPSFKHSQSRRPYKIEILDSTRTVLDLTFHFTMTLYKRIHFQTVNTAPTWQQLAPLPHFTFQKQQTNKYFNKNCHNFPVTCKITSPEISSHYSRKIQ